MKKQLLLIFIFALTLSFISADYLGTFKVNEPMEITNYCNSGSCTYITLESIEYPNKTISYINMNMTKVGQTYNYSFTPTSLGTYYFVSCGDSTIDICDKDSFFVNFGGEEIPTSIMIILLIFFCLLFVGYYSLNGKINYDKWYDSISNKYQHRNFVKFVLSAIGYNFIKNKFSNYYFLGFPIIIILTDLILTYNINSLNILAENLIFVYSLGIIVVAITFIGLFQELIVKLIKDASDNSWGLNDK